MKDNKKIDKYLDKSTLLFIHDWENIWIHAFPKGINPKWNISSFIQDLTQVTDSISYITHSETAVHNWLPI